MYKNRPFLLLIIILILSLQTAVSQNNTNSPYTRYGYGEISDNTSGEQRAMGGTAIGARSKHRINTVNPASYSVSDSLTFMLDFGASGLLSRFTEYESRKKNSFNANLEYLTMQFRLFKGVGLSVGLLPYSFAGYNFHQTDSITMPGFDPDDEEVIKHTVTNTGTGGFSQVYLGLGADLFNHLSLGANMYYMFGSYNNRIVTAYSSDAPDTDVTNAIAANNLRFRFGAQFYNTFADKHNITLGVIYEPKMALKADATQTAYSLFTEPEIEDTSNGFELPQIFGGGIHYKYDEKLSIAVDYTFMQWSDVLFEDKKELVNQSKFALGAEYQRNYRSRRYSDQIMYRFGVNTSNPYYTVKNFDMGQNFGITFGVGLPLKSSSRTMLNMAVEYGKIGSASSLREDYFKFTFNFALAETWFFKRKL